MRAAVRSATAAEKGVSRRRRARTRKRRGRTAGDGGEGRMLCLYKKDGGREYNRGCERGRARVGGREGGGGGRANGK